MPERIEKAAKLVCKDCGHENEPQRVYCHNCGTKLERAVLPKTAAKTASEKTRKQTLKRVRTIGGNHQSFAQLVVVPLVKVILYGGLAASLIEMVRTPDDVPANAEPTGSAPLVAFDLDAMLNAPQSLKRTYTQDELNEYLKTTVKSEGSMAMGTVEFERVFVNLYQDNVCRIGVEQTVGFGSEARHGLYATIFFTPENADGHVTPKHMGGSIGRLNIPPELMKTVGFILNPIWTALDKEIDRLSKMQSIVVGDKKVEVISVPGRGS